MKLIYSSFSIATLVLILISCNSNPVQDSFYIDLTAAQEVERFSLDELNVELEIIELELTENSVFSEALGLEVSSNYILVESFQNYDNYRLLLFTRSGSFIGQIGRQGQGPGEYLQLTDAELSIKEDAVFLLDRFMQRIHIYSTHLNHIKSIEVPGYPLQMEMISDSTVLLTYQKPMMEDDQLLIKYNINSKEVENLMSDPEYFQWEGGSQIRNAGLDHLKSEYRFWDMTYDTLFTINQSLEVMPYAVFNLGPQGLPLDQRVKGWSIKDLKDKVFINHICELSSYFLIQTVNWQDSFLSQWYVYDKGRSSLSRVKQKEEELPIWINKAGSYSFWPTYTINHQVLGDVIQTDDGKSLIYLIHDRN